MTSQRDVDALYDGAMHVLARTGCLQYDLVAVDSLEPPVWVAVGAWSIVNGIPTPDGPLTMRKVGAALDPLSALVNLCEKAIDGGLCGHCGKPCGFDDTLGHDPMPAGEAFCWIQWDPELRLFRSGCGFTYRPTPRTEGEPG